MRSAGQMERQAEKLLRGWLSAKAKITSHGAAHDGGADLVVRDGPATLVIELKRLGEPGWLGGAIEQVQAAARTIGRSAVPVVAVPFMAEGGRSLCQEAKVSWFDLRAMHTSRRQVFAFM